MKSFQTRLLIAALAVCLGSALAKSQAAENAPPPPPPDHHGFGMEGHMTLRFWAEKLNLTDEQKTQMKAVMQKEHPTMKPLFEQQRQIDQQLHQYAEGAFDAAKVQTLARQKAKVQAQLTVAETRIHNELYQLLTSDQQTQLKQMETEHEARMEQRMQQHAPPADEN